MVRLLVIGAMLPCSSALLKPPMLNNLPSMPSMPWDSPSSSPTSEGRAAIAIRKYFDAWNRRDMETACAQFADECSYEDTQYAGAFTGKEALKSHLFKVADALPPTFEFCIDEVADGGDTVGVQWHVENGGVELPFTRGCSMYKADPQTGLLVSGFDVPEPAPFKPGSASLALLSVASKVIAEPIRAVPAVAWLLYVRGCLVSADVQKQRLSADGADR